MPEKPARFLLTSIFFVASLACAQSIAPAPTTAGFPFWHTIDSGKITRGNDGAVWFAENAGEIGRLSLKGSYKSFIVDQVNGGGSQPTGIYWGPDNNVWFGTFSGIVGKINPSTGVVTKYQLPDNPVFDLTRGPDGNLWATVGTFVYRISTSGAFTKFSLGQNTGSLLRTGPDHNMWIMETFGRKIFRMNTSGAILNTYSLTLPGQPGCGPTCAAITAGPDGNMWFTQNESDPVIGKITMSGQITYFPLQGQGAGDIAWGHDGALWFSDPHGHHLGRITTTGVVTYYDPVGQSLSSTLRCVSSASDGNIYFTGIRSDASGIDTGVGKIVLAVPRNTAGINIYPTHGTLFSGSVASFTDFETINGSFFNATISWGDGTSSRGSVTRVIAGSPNEYKVHASHTYQNKGKFAITITVKEPGDQYKFAMQASASVQ